MNHLRLRPLACSAALLVTGLLGPAHNAWAGRPLVTEDADVLERGHCEWESFGLHAKAEGLETIKGLSTQVGCGVGGGTQVALAGTRSRAGQDTLRAWTVGGKTEIVARDKPAGVGITLAWGAGWLKVPNTGFDHESTYLTVVATQALPADWLLHGNLGWVRSQSASQDSTAWNLAAETSLGHGVDLMGELYGDDRQRPWVGGGVRWTVREGLSVNASYAVQADTPRLKVVTVGFKLAF
ncbi:MAG: hypothetical protein V4739_15260 [Pseudomonadota bacterium]